MKDDYGVEFKRASDANYITFATCDECGKKDEGIMLHAASATGRVCPVLFLCNVCSGKTHWENEDENV